MAPPPIIGLVGFAQAGKTTVAKYLCDSHDYVRITFADPLKLMLYHGLGLSQEQLWGRAKGEPSPALCGRTPRHAMQTLGTEWGRQCIHPDLWLQGWARLVLKAKADGKNVVVDDCRFLNEAEQIRQTPGAQIWRIMRSAEAPPDTHSSELEHLQIETDIQIANVDSRENLHRFLDELMFHQGTQWNA